MGDTKQGREKQADDAEQRQRERELEEALERGGEAEPPDRPGRKLDDVDETLESLDYPLTTDDVIETHGDQTVESRDGRTSIGELLAPIDDETYDSADELRDRIREQVNRA